MRSVFCLLRVLLVVSTDPLVGGSWNLLCSGQVASCSSGCKTSRRILAAPGEGQSGLSRHDSACHSERLESRNIRDFSTDLECTTLFPGSRNRGQPSLGIQGLQLVETPAQESFHDRNSNERSRVGPVSTTDICVYKHVLLLRYQSYRRRATDDSSTGSSLLRAANVYKFAPRKPARFSQVWIAALVATLFLEFGQNVFVWYLGAFTSFNALYGVFGTIMGLLLWIYFSGVILLLGGCIAATIHSPRNAENTGDSVNTRPDRR